MLFNRTIQNRMKYFKESINFPTGSNGVRPLTAWCAQLVNNEPTHHKCRAEISQRMCSMQKCEGEPPYLKVSPGDSYSQRNFRSYIQTQMRLYPHNSKPWERGYSQGMLLLHFTYGPWSHSLTVPSVLDLSRGFVLRSQPCLLQLCSQQAFDLAAAMWHCVDQWNAQ